MLTKQTTLRWIVIYPVNSVIHLSNNPGLDGKKHQESEVSCLGAHRYETGKGGNFKHWIQFSVR